MAKGFEYTKEDLQEFKKLAEQGAPYGYAKLSGLYRVGYPPLAIAKNEKQAYEYAKKAYEAENAYVFPEESSKKKEYKKGYGHYALGACLLIGAGIEKDEKKGFSLTKESAAFGNPYGQTNLGCCYANGIGVEKDEKKAAEWFKKAAEHGNAYAQFILGWRYHNGIGVAKDEKAAVKWYEKAAEQGYELAQNNLGWCYHNGKGVAKDEKEATRWYMKAAEQGYEDAKLRLKNEPFPNIEKSIVLENTGDKHIEFLPNCDSKIDRINLALSNYKESFSLYKDDAVLEKILKAYISFFRYVDEKTNFDMQTDAFIEASKYAKEYYDDAKKQNSEFIRVYRNKTILFFRALDKNDRQDLMQKLSESICIFADFNLKAQPEVQQCLQKVNRDINDNKEVETNDMNQLKRENQKLEIFEKFLQKKLEDSLHNDRVIYQGLAQRKEDSIDTTLKVASILGGTVQNHWVGFVGNLGANMTKEIRDKIHKHACERTKMFSGLRIGDVTIKVAKRVTDRYKDQIEKLSVGPGGGVEKLVEYFHNKAIDDLHSSVSTIDALWKKLSGFEEIISSPEEKLFESLTKAGGENCYLQLDETLGDDFASINRSKVGRAWDAKEMLLQIAFSFNSTTYLSNNNGINGFEKYGCCYVNLAEEIKDRKIYTTQLEEQKCKDKDKVKSGFFSFW